MSEYDDIFDFVRDKLAQSSYQCGKNKATINYSRFSHIERVYGWVQRILTDLSPDISIHKEALRLAAILHDVGYGFNEGDVDHAQVGAMISEEYLEQRGYDKELLREVVYLVGNHSHKELLRNKETPIELIILMEADLLDDTGALALVMDTMIVTKKRKPDFYKVYSHMQKYAVKEMKENPMVTEPARRFWKEKQRLTEEFNRQLMRDLDI